jgi:predicted Zn-dependent peptidase
MNTTSHTLRNGVSVHFINDTKFKTTTLSVNFTRPLSRKEVTFNSLLPAVLRRGCKSYPETRKLNIYLDELYDAVCEYTISKKGDAQVISFIFKTVANRFAPELKPFEKLTTLAGEILFNPLAQDNSFSSEYTAREKENLKQLIESIVNDKREYAKKRLIESMYEGEAYGIFEYGYTSYLNSINEKNLYEHYAQFIHTSHIDIIVTGPCNEDEVMENLGNIFGGLNISPIPYPEITAGKEKQNISYVTDEESVTQGKLTIGFRTPVTIKSDEYYATMVMNNLFGGATHSKLFMNVREKLSLAYYAGSGYNSFKGLVVVSCGIEFDKYEITLREVMNQLDEIKKGNITDEELEYSKLALANTYKSSADSAGALDGLYLSQILSGKAMNTDELIKNINAVTKAEVANAASMLTADTVYFLKGRESND